MNIITWKNMQWKLIFSFYRYVGAWNILRLKSWCCLSNLKAFADNQTSCICVKLVSMWATYYNIAGNNFNLLVLLLFVERIGCFLISNFIAKYIISPTRKGRKVTEGITLIIRESVTILFIIEKSTNSKYLDHH